MPRNKPKHKKLAKVEDANGWTHVIRGPRFASSELNLAAAKDDTTSRPSNLTTGPTLSLDQIRKKHSKSQESWAEDPLRNRFEDIFTSKIAGSVDLVIDNVLVLGLGSLAVDGVDRSSVHQLVLFECWIGVLRLCLLRLDMAVLRWWLGARYDIQKIYFQDPHFCPEDRAFLTERGYLVVDDPEAYLLLTPSTFFFAPYLPWQVTHTFFYVCYPALYVGNDVCKLEGSSLSLETRIVLGQPVIKDFYISRSWSSLDGRGITESLHGPKHGQWLHDIAIYWPYRSGDQEKWQHSENELEQSNTNLRKTFSQEILSVQQTLYSGEKIPFRAGAGEWRTNGFVFDDNLRGQVQEIQARRMQHLDNV